MAYPDPKEFEKKVKEYFAQDLDYFTLGGLAVYLDISHRTLRDYAHRPGYEETMTWAKTQILAQREYQLLSGKGSTTGTIFYLKNTFGWADKRDVRHEIDKRETKIIDITKLPDEVIEKLHQKAHGKLDEPDEVIDVEESSDDGQTGSQ